ncbi:sulfate/thiosulfate transporter permease subunit [Pectobacterium versatile]|nr:sulfate/thiosulfate transporter permease subunit [Pectobacterium versatile]
MAEIPTVTPQRQSHPVRQERNWARAALIALGVILSLIMLVIPLVSIFAAALSHGLGASGVT